MAAAAAADDGERAELRQRMKPVRQWFSVVTINRQNRIDQRGKREGERVAEEEEEEEVGIDHSCSSSIALHRH